MLDGPKRYSAHRKFSNLVAESLKHSEFKTSITPFCIKKKEKSIRNGALSKSFVEGTRSFRDALFACPVYISCTLGPSRPTSKTAGC